LYKNVIFDFDGVIINSHDVQVKALTESYRVVCGKDTPPYDDFFRLSGDSLKNIFTQLDLPLEMIPVYQRISIENMGLIKIHEGMVGLLKRLDETGYGCALCTGKDRGRTIEILKHFDLEHYFQAVVCSDDVANPKPHPESLLLAMRVLGAAEDDTVMVGDGINDIISAKRANISSIAVTWGDVGKEDLMKCNSEYLVETAGELTDIIYVPCYAGG